MPGVCVLCMCVYAVQNWIENLDEWPWNVDALVFAWRDETD